MVRFFSSQPYAFHFQATLTTGKPVPEEDIEEFSDYIAEVLFDWNVDGVDDSPDPDPSY